MPTLVVTVVDGFVVLLSRFRTIELTLESFWDAVEAFELSFGLAKSNGENVLSLVLVHR